ncbi:COX15/CtaA family protein [Propylenella binzhouense]|uniref:Heme A synthase n=1 Tax=Propylenella binzhouense TaxID=2555902 RepID=A0A964T5E7_9HYPH|nr:COX15/CtaA family protein [Propylenella binzhouense]MYZ48490.1 heme A synthase [Propylenella binzhouense]
MSVSAVPLVDHAAARARREGRGALRVWLGTLIAMVFAMVVVGGATRLTDSGLSITEWKPVVGAVPPLSSSAWTEEFNRYRLTSQYRVLNQDMTLREFKTIYWWEWSHRQLGRLIGAVFLFGLIWAAVTRRVDFRTGTALLGMGVLLGTQGLVGWIMVASGLQPGMTAVAPVKLALHLTLACLFFSALVALYVRIGQQSWTTVPRWTRRAAIGIVVLVFGQIALGALVAGHDAGLTYNTWPLMDGRFVPQGLWPFESVWRSLVDDITTIQFNHRIGAYLLSAAILLYVALSHRLVGETGRRQQRMLLAVVALQVCLGILTLVFVVPLPLALAHQAVALLLLGGSVAHAATLHAA